MTMNVTQDLVVTIQRLSRCRDLAEVTDVLRSTARRLTGADGVTIVLREGEYCHYAEEDAVGPLWRGRRFPLEACISGWSMLHRQQVVVPDIYADARIPHDAYRPTFVKSLIMTPIRQEDPIGAIGAYWATPHEGDEQERMVLQALADSASVAIANAELISSLAAANERKDAFITMLAHELRNPLAPIWNAAYLLRLQSKPDDASAERAYGAIERQMRHMTRLVEELVDSARITHGKLALKREHIDLAALVRDTAEDWRAPLEQAGLELVMEVPVVALPAEADATRVTQIMGNLLDNARKYTPPGGRVSVELSADAPNGQAVLVIRDTGAGISSQDLPLLFEPFGQADRSLDRERGGLGLGLAIARDLAELHGGSLRADSAGPNHGAFFTLRLPLAAQAVVAAAPSAETGSEAARARILIVEDNQDAAETMRIYLEYLGYQVSVANTGPDGVARAQQEHPDVILCDIGLPGLDGYGVAQTVRAYPATQRARLIAITGYGSEEARARALSAGFDVHLVKPVDLRSLPAHFNRAVA